MNKKKVQNAIKTQQRKGAVYKPTAVNPPVTYKPTVSAPLPLGVRRTLPVVRPAVPTKLPGVQAVGLTPQVRPQIVPRTMVGSVSTSTQYVQRLQPKPQVTQQRVYTQAAVPNQISRPSGYTANTGIRFVVTIAIYGPLRIIFFNALACRSRGYVKVYVLHEALLDARVYRN